VSAATHYCANHPGVNAARVCGGCGRPFCEQCLTEIQGTPVCGWCRDLRLAGMQGRRYQTPPVDPRQVIFWARVFNAVMLVTGVGCSALGMAFGMLPFWLEDPQAASDPAATWVPVVYILIYSVGILASLVLYLPPAIALSRPRPWMWTWQFVALILSIIGSCVSFSPLSACFVAPPAVLIYYWTRPEVRAYCE
jgi:hypothetical protein